MLWGNHCAGCRILQCRYRPCRMLGACREQISLFWISQIKNQLILDLAEKTSAYVGSRREKTNSLFWISESISCFCFSPRPHHHICLVSQRKDYLILSLAGKKHLSESRREQICCFWISLRTNQFILSFPVNKSAYFGSRTKQISWCWVSQTKQICLCWVSQKTNRRILALAKNKSA